MDEIVTNTKDASRQHKAPWLKAYEWKKGQSGNPKGKQAKSLKEWVRDYINDMDDEDRKNFLKHIPVEIAWRMAEGNPHQTTDLTTAGKPIPILEHAVPDNDGNKKDSENVEEDPGSARGNLSEQDSQHSADSDR